MMPRSLFLIIAMTSATARGAEAVATPGPWAGMLQTLAALAFVVALIGALAWLAKRRARSLQAGGALLKVVAAHNLGAHQRVVVVEIGASWLVLGVTAAQINTLCTLPRAADSAPPEAPPPFDFARLLQRTLGHDKQA